VVKMATEENVDRVISDIDEKYKKRFGESLRPDEPEMLEPVGHAAEPVMLEPVKHGTKSTLSGVLLILAGMLAIITWGYSVFLGFPLISIEFNTLIVFAAAGSVFAIFAVIAGIMAATGKSWKTCIIFSILGILSIGFLISSTLCLIAFIGLLMAKKEFT